MEGERKRRRGLTNFYFAPEFIFVKVREDDEGLTGRSVYCFLTNLFTSNLRGRKPNPPLTLISSVSHSIPSLSASAREHSLRSLAPYEHPSIALALLTMVMDVGEEIKLNCIVYLEEKIFSLI
jgi:hypothetical protein